MLFLFSPQAIRNELLMQKVIQSMQTRVYKLESSELQKITKQSQDEAIRISLILAAHPAPPMPAFDLDPQFTDPEALAQAVDDILGKVKDGSEYGINYFEEYAEGKGDGKGSGSSSVSDAPPLSDVEATKLCTEWKTNYSVVTGVSWGNLPYDLQQKWLHYSCDYHLGDPNTGGTKVTSTGASSSSSGQGADVLLQYDDKNFFLEENKEEGAAKAPSRDRR